MVKVGQVYDVRGIPSRVCWVGQSGAQVASVSGLSWRSVSFFAGRIRLDGHPWETDPEWQDGDTYHLLATDGEIYKVRGGKRVTWCQVGDCVVPLSRQTEWGPALTFTPQWEPVAARRQASDGDRLAAATPSDLPHLSTAERMRLFRAAFSSDAAMFSQDGIERDGDGNITEWRSDGVPERLGGYWHVHMPSDSGYRNIFASQSGHCGARELKVIKQRASSAESFSAGFVAKVDEPRHGAGECRRCGAAWSGTLGDVCGPCACYEAIERVSQHATLSHEAVMGMAGIANIAPKEFADNAKSEILGQQIHSAMLDEVAALPVQPLYGHVGVDAASASYRSTPRYSCHPDVSAEMWPRSVLADVAHEQGIGVDSLPLADDVMQALYEHASAKPSQFDGSCECHLNSPCHWHTDGIYERIDELCSEEASVCGDPDDCRCGRCADAHAKYLAKRNSPESHNPLTRDQLIAAVSGLCPPDLVEAAWRYAVSRIVAAWEDGPLIDTPEQQASRFAGRMRERDGYRISRLYEDGLRNHALALLLERRPDDLTPWGWERVCRARIECRVSTPIESIIDDATALNTVAYALSELVRCDGTIDGSTYRGAPQPSGAPWWDKHTQGPNTRGEHGDDVDGGGL